MSSKFDPYYTTNSTYGDYFDGIINGPKNASIPPPTTVQSGENYFDKTLNMKKNINQSNEFGSNNLNEIYRPKYDVKKAEMKLVNDGEKLIKTHTTFIPNSYIQSQQNFPYHKTFKDTMFVFQTSFPPCYSYNKSN
jgi:hypothetical protein